MTQATPEPPTLVERRVRSAVDAADAHRTGVPLDELSQLLPTDGPSGPGEVAGWIEAHPHVAQLVDGRAVTPGTGPAASGMDGRKTLAAAYWAEARSFAAGALAPAHGLVRCVGVTGSTAYGEPEPGDDLDFLVVTRSGATWLFLAFAYLALRRRRRGAFVGEHRPSDWCFNFVVDDRDARARFSRPQGFLFAREALMTQVLVGDAYYRGLLSTAPWIQEEVPRLHARWTQSPLPPLPPEEPASWTARVANALVFPLLAPYLQIVGLVRNRRLGRREPGRGFRTITTWRRMAIESYHFDRLTEIYAPASSVRPATSRQ